MVAKLSLQEQFSMPLVKQLIEENDKLRAVANLDEGGTKIPDSQIEGLTIPYIIKNKLFMQEGEFNGITYNKEEIILTIDDMNEKGLMYDHLDTANQGASAWLGTTFNARWDDNGPEGPGAYGDLKIIDKTCAQKLAAGAKFGISPTIDYQKNEVGDTTFGTDLLWKSFSFVISPAVRDTMLNTKIEGEKMAHDKDKKYPYKYPAKNQDDDDEKKRKKKIKAEEELQVDARTLEVLEAKDAEITDLQKFKTEVEMVKKAELVAELVSNEYLIGRLGDDEMNSRKDVLMEKSEEVLTELAEVIGAHAELSKFTNFVNSFNKSHKGATLADATKAWEKHKGKGKLDAAGDNPAADAGTGADNTGDGTEADTGTGTDDAGKEQGKDNTSTLTGQDALDGRELAELKAKHPNTVLNQTDVDMHAALIKIGSGGVR